MSADPPRAEIEFRKAAVSEVRFDERVIDLVAVPYDEWAVVEYKGRLIEEQFRPGAFGADIQKRANRFLVLMEHDPERIAGRVRALHPEREEGLVAELRVRRGAEGDQVLEDADDGMIGASIGFAALPENQHWETRTRRRILKAFLDHIALTFTPAYEGANVLAVRSSMPSTGDTPNLDRIYREELLARYGRG